MKEIMPRNIWSNGNPNEGFFRKEFTLKNKPGKAVLRIFCDTGYELYLNDEFAAAIDEHNNTRDYNVRPFLRRGRNLIAVHALNHCGHRGLCAELRIDDTRSITTGTDWLASDSELWDWHAAECDTGNGNWKNAAVLPLQYAGMPQWSTRPGGDPEKIVPVCGNELFAKGAVPKFVDSPFYTAKRSEEKTDEAVRGIIGDTDAVNRKWYPPALRTASTFYRADDTKRKAMKKAVFTAPERYTGPAFIVDFGHECAGRLRFAVKSKELMHCRILYGEGLDECHHEPPRTSLVHRMLTEDVEFFPGSHQFESRNRVGFRYARVEFFDCGGEVTLDKFAVKNSVYPLNYRGWFHCSDEKLNRIWLAGRNTLHWCMQEYYLDGIKRDRLLWTGDTRMQALINYHLFGDAELFKFCWRSIGSCQYPDGAIPSAMVEGSSLIWDYVMLYLIAVKEYEMYTGDGKFAAELSDVIRKAADWLLSKCGKDGLIDIPVNPYPVWMVVLNKATGKNPYVNKLLRGALDAAAFALRKCAPADSARFAAAAEQCGKALARIIRKQNGKTGKPDHLPSESLELFAMTSEQFAAGDAEAALATIRDNWYGAIGLGYDTLPEAPNALLADPAKLHGELKVSSGSYCHGWTAGPCCALVQGVFGIIPLEPGFKKFSVKIQTGGLKQAETAVPTPHGQIAAAFRTGGGKTTLELAVPEGCAAELEFRGKTVTVREGHHKVIL